ncbi:MAG: C4-dicarboxylate-binding protein DctP [Clostridia bacterium]|nr:C4-dicarboxylate-binding protein DctP [Clostridia bacterium]
MLFSKIRFLVPIILISFLLAACGGGGGQKGQPQAGGKPEEKKQEQAAKTQQIVAKFPHVVAPDTPKGKAISLFAKRVEEKTQGKMKVEVFPSSQLYGDAEEMEALLAGNCHFIAPSSTKVVQLNPSFQIFDVPFLFDSEEAVKIFWNDPNGGQAMQKKLEPKGLMGLGFLCSGFKQLFSSRRPLLTPEDCKGLKFRAAAGGILTEQFQALGATSVSIPFGEVYTALQQKTVDGSENNLANIYTQKFYEVCPYLTITNHGRFDYSIITNKKWFEGLPADVQNAVREAAREAQEFSQQEQIRQDNEYLEKIKQSGKVQVFELTPEQRAAFRKAEEAYYPKWEERIGKDLFDAAREANEAAKQKK